MSPSLRRLLPHPNIVVLAALLSLPLLGPHHYFPVPTFYQEWLAGALGILCIGLAAWSAGGHALEVPRIALLPAALALVLWLQYLLGFGAALGSTVLGSAALLWACGLMICICRLESQLGRDRLADAVALSLLMGALFQAATGWVQMVFPQVAVPGIFPGDGAVKGNIAQTNSFANHLWLGVAGTIHLFVRGKIGASATLAVGLPLLALSLLSGSRSVYLYAAGCSAWAALMAAISPAGDFRRRFICAAAGMLPLLLLIQMTIGLGNGTAIDSAQRIATQGTYDPVRLTLWRAALDIFLAHPWAGAGFDSYSREFFMRVAEYPIHGFGIPEHSHNLVAEIAAETGLLGLVPLFVGGGTLILDLTRTRPNAASSLGLSLLVVLGIHSALEYPLWYLYFLGIGAIALALVEPRRFACGTLPLRPAAVFVATCALLGTMVLWRMDYTELEDAAQGYHSDGRVMAQDIRIERFTTSYQQTIWRSYAALQLSASASLDRTENPADLAVRCAIVAEAVAFSPIRQAVFRHAALQAMCGADREAKETLMRAMAAYPADIPIALALYQGSNAAQTELKPLIELLHQRSL